MQKLTFTVAILLCNACIPVPEPGEPNNGERVVGADYSGIAFGHWACPQTDVIVANQRGRMILHELTLDYVISESTKLPNGDLGFVMDMGSSKFSYDIPQDPSQPLAVTTRPGAAAVPCPSAPIPKFLK